MADYASLIRPTSRGATIMEQHRIVSRGEWITARKTHLAEEKAFTRARDALSRKRRELPWVKVDKAYAFDGRNGKETLADLFGDKSQLIVYHFRWVSSFASDFNYDYQVSASPEEKATGKVMYNYEVTEFPSEERPGASVFFKNAAGEVFHTYSA